MKTKIADKRIFIFSDGTGNSARSTQKTNVWRMFQALEKDAPNGRSRSKEPIQLSFYDSGVGTSQIGPMMWIGQIFGFGLKQNVLEAYSFICTHYTPESEIYLIGFSRGAFTMRMLAALIGSQGILKVGFQENDVDPAQLNTYAKFAYQRLSDAFPTNGNFVLGGIRKARRFISDAVCRLTGKKSYNEINRHSQLGNGDSDGAADITFMGLYDTVAAYGGPVEELTKAFNWLFWPAEPADWHVGKYVKKVCHALALDEPRHSFTPKMITEAEAGKWTDPNSEPTVEEGDRIEQVWFAGAHANIGGGYANDGLSMIPLTWMISKLKTLHNVRFNKERVDEFEGNKDCCAPLNDPRSGLGGVYRYSPRNLNRLTEDMHNQIYVKKPKIHFSVFKRIVENPGYAPFGLNKPYVIVDDKGPVKTRSEYKTLQPSYSFIDYTNAEDKTGTSRNPLESGSRYNAFIEKVWDRVWGKRIVYFTHLFFGLGLLAAPWLLRFFDKDVSLSENDCEQHSCLLNAPLDAVQAGIDTFLPFGLTSSPWINTVKSFPSWAFGLAALWLVFYFVGRYQKVLVNTTLAQYWLSLAEKAHPPTSITKPSTVYRLRSSQPYQQAFLVLKQYLLPWSWAIALIFLAIFGVNQSSLYTRENSLPQLAYCPAPGEQAGRAVIDTRNLCNDTFFDVKKGNTYELAIRPEPGCKLQEADDNSPWRDLSIAASTRGIKPSDRSYISETFGLSFKRFATKKFFEPVIQIGNTFPEYPELRVLEKWITEEGKSEPRWRFEATQNGRAYYYVNDAVLGFLPESAQWFYKNNCGTGSLHIINMN